MLSARVDASVLGHDFTLILTSSVITLKRFERLERLEDSGCSQSSPFTPIRGPRLAISSKIPCPGGCRQVCHGALGEPNRQGVLGRNGGFSVKGEIRYP